MLTLLKIRNIAVVEEADISFDKGFSVLTGETGAGKSMIIDAVRMILGDRISRDIIRTGEKKASVYAEFVFPDRIPASVAEIVDSDKKLCLYREISQDGKNLCRVNGQTVQTALLRTLGERLVDIHGQHDSRNLLDPERHIEYIDIFAGLDGEVTEYRKMYAELKSIAKEIRGLQMDQGEKLRRTEMLTFQIREIEQVRLSADEEQELTEKKTLLANGEKVADRLQEALRALSGTQQEQGASQNLSDALQALSATLRVSEKFEKYMQPLQEAQYSVDDVIASLESECDELSFSPDELDRVESRLDQIYRIKRKYGADIPSVMEYLRKAKEELSLMDMSEERRDELSAEYRVLRQKVLIKANELSRKRHEASVVLSRRIEEELGYLDMPHTRFVVEFTSDEGEQTNPFHANGIDTLEFFLSVNRGENLKPLSKTASGGELSRIMLALKNVMTDKDSIPVQIFDEIDTGISGRAAEKVANKLWTLARGRQVLCVTHLSQLAAMADDDYLIEKKEKNDRTVTCIRRLSEDERAHEIARINVGTNITSLALDSAGQMLSQCKETQNRLQNTLT